MMSPALLSGKGQRREWHEWPLVLSGNHLGVAVASTGKTAEAGSASIGAGQTLREAGHRMRELGVAVLCVRGENGEAQGTISRDMVIKRIAAGGDPKTVTVGEVTSAARRARPRPATRSGHGLVA